tara:strand:- start:812 stop:1549 length:738 start_codon:yes stop_codon:yes gene_type:complete
MNEFINLEAQNKPLFFQHKNNYIKLTFPEKGKVRMRKVSTRSRARPTGEYPSWKMGRMLEWESHNELNAFVLLDASPSITSFGEQPMEIEYCINGAVGKHIPDVLVAKNGALQVWEIKPEREAKKDDVRIRTDFLTEYLPKIGYSYHVVTGEELSNKLRLHNARTILKFGRDPIDGTSREILRVYFLSNDSISWLDDIYTNSDVDIRCVLSRLTLEGILVPESNERIGKGSLFRLKANGTKGVSL